MEDERQAWYADRVKGLNQMLVPMPVLRMSPIYDR